MKKMFLMSSRNIEVVNFEDEEVVNFEDEDHLLNKRSELISECRHTNKYLLRNYKQLVSLP